MVVASRDHERDPWEPAGRLSRPAGRHVPRLCAHAGRPSRGLVLLCPRAPVPRLSVGLDQIDLAKCKERGIRVTTTPDVLTDDVADLAIGLMLAVLRRICECDTYLRRGAWKKGDFKLTTKFSGKRMGIVGLGRIGLAIARRAQAFDCPISYYSRTKKPNTNYEHYKTVVELASNCDILVVACALTPKTRHIVNREVIDSLSPNGVLVNIGRGDHIRAGGGSGRGSAGRGWARRVLEGA